MVSGNEVRLNWSAGTDNLALAGYQVFRNGIHIGGANGTFYLDTTTQPGTTYNYSVVAMDVAELTSNPSNTVTVTPIGLFNDDFESNNLSRWTSVTNLTVQQQEVFAGNYAARGTRQRSARVALRLLSADKTSCITASVLRSQPGADHEPAQVPQWGPGNGKSLLGVLVNKTGNLEIRNDIALQTTTSQTQVSRGVWHELQVRVRISGSAGEAEVWLDGNRVNSLSKPEAFGAYPIRRLQLGENGQDLNFDVAFDDVTVDIQFISPLRPNHYTLLLPRQPLPPIPLRLRNAHVPTATQTSHLFPWVRPSSVMDLKRAAFRSGQTYRD